MPLVNNTITTNADQRLFVIPCLGGSTTLGFDVCHDRAKRLAVWLNVSAPTADIGSVEYYHEYEALMKAAKEAYDRFGVRCPIGLSPQLVGLEGKRVEVVDTNGNKRRFWVGKSTGWLPIHLEIRRRGNIGGGAADYEYASILVIRTN